MDLNVDIGINEALDLGWKTLNECFRADEVEIKQDLIDKFWPGQKVSAAACDVGTNQAQ
jgi:V/A-type H+-transporting ATPase subunit B